MSNKDSRLEVNRKHPLIGAEVRGIDLSQPPSNTISSRLHKLWMKYLVLVFPDQPISDEQHIAFGQTFGPLEFHPSRTHRSLENKEIYRVSNVDENGRLIPPEDISWKYLNQSWRWHTDSSFREIPSMGSILHGIEVTNKGGNTLFANMYAAYDTLSQKIKSKIEGLWVIHDHDHILSLAPGLQHKKKEGLYDYLPPVSHPLVCIHPITHRRSLFLSPHTMTGIEGMSDLEGREILDELIEHATQEQLVYQHIWKKDDIIMWDNRCTMHSVEPFDNKTIRRIMHRVTLVGESRPISPTGSAMDTNIE